MNASYRKCGCTFVPPRFLVYPHFTKTFLQSGCICFYFIVIFVLENMGKEIDMINKEFGCSDVDDMIFDVDDFYISEK